MRTSGVSNMTVLGIGLDFKESVANLQSRVRSGRVGFRSDEAHTEDDATQG